VCETETEEVSKGTTKPRIARNAKIAKESKLAFQIRAIFNVGNFRQFVNFGSTSKSLPNLDFLAFLAISM
jgi:hypothetical protein